MLTGYPRPQMERSFWLNLNGTWEFAFDDKNIGESEKWYENFTIDKKEIQVPYTYETKMSGIGIEEFHPVVWYRREVELNGVQGKTILNFEGVDYEAKVWVNGVFAGSHRGAYSRFSMDITDLISKGKNVVTLRAEDSQSCIQPRGKQRWKDENFLCWYVQTTGIWKSVWIENVAETYVKSLKITPDIDRSTVRFEIRLNRKPLDRVRIKTDVSFDGDKVTSSTIDVNTECSEFEISLANGDRPWEVRYWSPNDPALYDVNLQVISEDGCDEVKSYFGMRKVSIENGEVLLNNRPIYQRLILDQGYWEDSHLTPPSEEAIIKDVDLIMAAGFNGLRKHQKVEDERFLYWCDKKGLLVWCEMPSAYSTGDDVVETFTNEWMQIVRQNYNHPSIITWTAFNESWGVEHIYTNVNEQKFTEGIYHLTKAFDPMRPVIVNDGWEHTVSDILTLHDYEEKGEEFSKRYSGAKEKIVNNELCFNKDRYAFAKGYSYKGQPIIISEYGGIAFTSESGWGYGNQVKSEKEYLERYESITQAIKDLDYNVGFCYTQITDVQQEINGLYTMKREPKVDIDRIREINLK